MGVQSQNGANGGMKTWTLAPPLKKIRPWLGVRHGKSHFKFYCAQINSDILTQLISGPWRVHKLHLLKQYVRYRLKIYNSKRTCSFTGFLTVPIVLHGPNPEPKQEILWKILTPQCEPLWVLTLIKPSETFHGSHKYKFQGLLVYFIIPND